MKNIKIINKTNDKFIEEIVKNVITKAIQKADFLDEVEVYGEDGEKGEIYLSSGDAKYTIQVTDMEELNVDKYTVAWILYKEKKEVLVGEDSIEVDESLIQEDECVEFKSFKSDSDNRYIIENIDEENTFNKEKLQNDFEEYLENKNIDNIDFIITPYGVEGVNRIQFELIDTNCIIDGICHKTIIALRKLNEENDEFKIDDRYLAYDECNGKCAMDMMIEFLNKYYK